MTSEEALIFIQSATQWEFTTHAVERMSMRGATKADVRHAITNAESCEASETRAGAWLVSGLDRDDEPLTVSVVIEFILTGHTRNVIITVF
jgi:hypothetical protein